ncbi:MAG: histone deacetylase [Anaerolineae bacterium]|nr:histone deacetylase [Anaerolineae bacterium]
MEKLVFFDPLGHEAHFEPGHPERPERIAAVREALQQAGWWEQFPHLAPLSLPEPVLTGVHTPGYLSFLETACARGAPLDLDTYTTPASWQLALNAAGGAAAVAWAVWSGAARRGFALTRPPGHHATARQGMGFCLLNNIALAAHFTLTRPDAGIKAPQRLAIVDLDLHHGNGTQEIFYDRADVLFCSLHQSPLYPGSGSLAERGVGAGAGLTANLPLPPGTGDQGYRTALSAVVLPLLDRCQPEMLLVSLGYDAHWRDPLGSMLLSAAGYGTLIRQLADWADAHCAGKLVLVVEGGYDQMAAQACCQAATAALLGEAWTDPLGAAPQPERAGWEKVLAAAARDWLES